MAHLFHRIFLPAFLVLFPLSIQGEVVITEFLAANDAIVVPGAEAGRFDDWIELHNSGDAPQDLTGWHLTDDPGDLTAWTFPGGTTLAPGEFLIVFASGDGSPDSEGNLHTSFRLASSGEYLALVRPDATVASEYGPLGTTFPPQSPDVSYGLHPTDLRPVFFDTPTPGAANDPNGVARVAGLEVSPRRGLYQSAQTISLATSTPGATIYYTTDGNPPLGANGTPTASATSYDGPFEVSRTAVVRAAATAPDFSPSLEQAHTYLLFDIDNANPDGTDSAGLNTPLLQQSRPAGYGNLASGDYNMDPEITRSAAPSAGHGGLTVAQAMLEGLRETPTISISMPGSDFVDLYANPQQEGVAWERLCSAEFIPGENDSRTDFQEHCGLRVQGGASRIPNRSPKHSLSFRFREEYGAGRLRQVLFPEVEVANFNSIALRAGYNNSWIHSSSGQRIRGSMIRDQWMRESLFDMGNEDAGVGFLAHLFVNGLYWGLHNVTERQDNAHYANYNGGDSELIDARNGSKYVEGNSTAWNAMRSVVSSRNWEEIQQVVDIDSYIDYQLIQRYGSNQDLKVDGNWRAAGGGPFDDPTEMRPWKLYSWDGERVLESPGSTSVPRDPMGIRSTLESIPEYRQRFADRAYQHLTGDGALTPDRCRARWEKHASAIDKAIIAESARWGDHRESTPLDRDDWLREQSRLYNSYFPVRTNNVINSLKSANLYPRVEPPVLAINGEQSTGGFVGGNNSLSLTGEEGTIYYTTDGTDPRLPDGSVNPAAVAITPGGVPTEAFPFEASGWRFLDDGTPQSGSSVVFGYPSYDTSDWKHPDYNDGAWGTGQGLLAGPVANVISGRIANTVFSLSGPSGRLPTVYFRKEFEVTDADAASTIDLSLVRDDGVIVYLNGREIFRDNMPAGPVSYDDLALSAADETEILQVSHSLAPGELRDGTNVIAIELHNNSLLSSDLGLDASATVSRANLTLEQSSELIARARSDNDWSARASGVFLLEESPTPANLVISEINYHPREVNLDEFLAASPLSLDVDDANQFEFLELRNTGASPLNLYGATFMDGIDFTFGLRVLAPGEHALLVRNPEAFRLRYGDDLADTIAGTFSGALNNDGETLLLVDSTGTTITSLTYNDAGSWPARADGDGSSLELLTPDGDPNDSASWQSSLAFHGSPGAVGPTSDQRLVINEVGTNLAVDFIELRNTTDSPIDIGGWLLTDDKAVYRSFTLPDTTLGALEYLVIPSTDYDAEAFQPIENYSGNVGGPSTIITSANHGLANGDLITISGYGGEGAYNGSFEVLVADANTFGIRLPYLDNHPVKGSWEKGRSFGLSASNGDDLWLVETDDKGHPVRFVDHVEFAAAAPDTTLGRWPDSEGDDTLITMTGNTAGTPNSGPVIGPVIISEVHYAPTLSDLQEFVEITHTGSQPVSLAQWRLRGGLDFDFTSAHDLAPGQSLVVVSFDPVNDPTTAANFRASFEIPETIPLLGPASDGPLNDEGGTVRLQQAGPAPDFARITVDEVRYSSDSPWPLASGGDSLNRKPGLAFGNFAEAWSAAPPTPGSFGLAEDYPAWALANGVGSGEQDFDGDGLSNLLEFALGTDPKAPSRLPPVSLNATNAEITFPSHRNRSGVTLTLETSPNLQTWTSRPTVVASIEGPIQTNLLTVDLADNPTLYWRLVARETAGD